MSKSKKRHSNSSAVVRAKARDSALADKQVRDRARMDPVARNLAIQDALDPDASTSLKRDLDAGKPSEVDGLIFEVVRLGRKHHVPTPMYDRVAAKLGFNLEE